MVARVNTALANWCKIISQELLSIVERRASFALSSHALLPNGLLPLKCITHRFFFWEFTEQMKILPLFEKRAILQNQYTQLNNLYYNITFPSSKQKLRNKLLN